MRTRATSSETVSFNVQETPESPWLGLFLGSIAMVPFVIGAVNDWLVPAGDVAVTARLTVIWGGAILSFLTGVRSGLSFRTPGGPDVAQIVTMMWLYLLAIGALVSPWLPLNLCLLMAGYASMLVFDPLAARRQEAPLFFARLRPVQMLVPVFSLAAMLVRGLRLG